MAKKPYPTPKAPRSMDEISQDANQVQFALGREQYLVNIHTLNVSELVTQLTKLDQEGRARRELDAKVAAEAPKTEEAKS